MGRVKELLLEDEEQELIMEASKQLITKTNNQLSMAYADLLNPDDIFKNNCSIIQIVTADGEIHTFAPDDIIELHGLSVKVQSSEHIVLVIPFDKIVTCKYWYSE